MYVHCCDACTAKKGPTRRSHAPLQQYQVGAPMERVGVDILGPFPTTDSGNRYVLVAMDYFTKWPEAYAVPDQSASTTVEQLVCEMFCRLRATEELHSDQGWNFEAQVFVEHDWDCHLPLILWAYWSAMQESTGCMPAALMFEGELRTPMDLVFGAPPGTDLPTEPGLEYLRDLQLQLSEVHDLT
ncbi:hypothetical protein LDENG_00068330 [Lucifuga dentata]|nr:hypothetical protein LDENG_00068330 [Lucifuga dentata]